MAPTAKYLILASTDFVVRLLATKQYSVSANSSIDKKSTNQSLDDKRNKIASREKPSRTRVLASDLTIKKSTNRKPKKTISSICLLVIEAVLLMYKFETIEGAIH
jgi:hypothetical protein